MSALEETSRIGCPQSLSILCPAATANEPFDEPPARRKTRRLDKTYF